MAEGAEFTSEERPVPPAQPGEARRMVSNASGAANANANLHVGEVVDEVKIDVAKLDAEKPPLMNRILKQVEVLFAIAIFAGFGVVSRIYLGKVTVAGKSPSDDMASVPANPANFMGLVSEVLTANILGTIVIGIMSVVPTDLKHAIHPGIGIGFCGSLTTFSSWIYESVTTDELSNGGRSANSFGLVATKLVVTFCVSLVAWLVGRYVAETIKNLGLHKQLMNSDLLADGVRADDVADDDDPLVEPKKGEFLVGDSQPRFQFQNLQNTAPQKTAAKKLDKFKYKLETIFYLLVIFGWIAMVVVFFVRGEPGQGNLYSENKYDIAISILFGL